MTEEEKKVETGKVDDTQVDYIEAIKNLKQNTVDRSKYDELKAENKKLLDSIVNGQSVDVAGSATHIRPLHLASYPSPHRLAQ